MLFIVLRNFLTLGFKILSILYISFRTSLTQAFDITTKEFKLVILGLNPNYYTLI